MTEKTRSVTRRRRRLVVVSLMGAGVAAWAVRRRLDERLGVDDAWDRLPPAPRPVPAAPVPAAVPTPERAAVPTPEPALARAVPAAAAVVSVAAPARPAVRGAVHSLDDGSSPDSDYAVKGKVATKVFHTPDGAYYTRTRADVWFRTADDARAAGFIERVRRHR